MVVRTMSALILFSQGHQRVSIHFYGGISGRQRYALMPSFTASPSPHRLTNTRNAPAGTRRAILGPIHPPIRKPAASGSTSFHRTSPNSAKQTAARAFAIPDNAFLIALTRTSGSRITALSTTSSMTPAAAPKYPTYMATAKSATPSARRGQQQDRRPGRAAERGDDAQPEHPSALAGQFRPGRGDRAGPGEHERDGIGHVGRQRRHPQREQRGIGHQRSDGHHRAEDAARRPGGQQHERLGDFHPKQG